MSYSSTGITTTLDGAITAQTQDLYVHNGGIFRSPRNVVIQIGSEKILADFMTNNRLSGITRGYLGTTPASHSDNATVILLEEDPVTDTTDLSNETRGILETTGVTAGSYGDNANVPQLTVDAKGRITAAANVAIKRASSSAPGTASSTGTAGNVAYDSTHIYVCIATDTWVRATLATW